MANRKLDNRDEIIAELTLDLQRNRADFENYRKNAELQRENARKLGEESAVIKLLPVIDDINRAISNVPAELADDEWARGVVGLGKNLETILTGLGIVKIDTAPGVKFDPNLHDAVQFDENATGEAEVVESELQAGYLLNGAPIRHAMVRVTRR
jgi:molecular chaperone GrpE